SSSAARPWQLLLLSAATPEAREAATDVLAAHLREHPEEPLAPLADIAYTLAVGRKVMRHRRALVAQDGASAAEALASRDRGRLLEGSEERTDREVAFLLPGLGEHYPGMGRGLYKSEPAFRAAVDLCCDHLKPHLGYSLGEYTAACLAGVFSLEDALRVVALRAQWIERLPAGAMLALPLPEAEAVPLLGDGLSLAAVNGPAVCVAGGPAAAVEALEERLAARGLVTRRLRTAHAFHSPMMQPVAGELTRLLAGVRLQPPRIPYLSNVTGTWIDAAQAVDPAYWARHLLAPVRLGDGLAALWQDPDRLLLEAGPGSGLSSLALQHPDAAAGSRVAVPSLPGAHERRPEQAFALGALGRLWLGGAAVSWNGFWQHEERRRLRLPTYAFERRRYWIEKGIEQQETVPRTELRITAPEPPAHLAAAVATTRHSRPSLPTPYEAPAGA